MNCLATSLFAATGNEDWLRHWVQEEQFLSELEVLGFKPFSDNQSVMPEPGDVSVFYDNGCPVHACCHIGGGLVLNKNGQTRFNPIKVLHFATVLMNWPGQQILFRRNQ